MTQEQEKYLTEKYIRPMVKKMLKETEDSGKIIIRLNPVDMSALKRMANILARNTGASELIYNIHSDSFTSS